MRGDICSLSPVSLQRVGWHQLSVLCTRRPAAVACAPRQHQLRTSAAKSAMSEPASILWFRKVRGVMCCWLHRKISVAVEPQSLLQQSMDKLNILPAQSQNNSLYCTVTAAFGLYPVIQSPSCAERGCLSGLLPVHRQQDLFAGVTGARQSSLDRGCSECKQCVSGVLSGSLVHILWKDGGQPAQFPPPEPRPASHESAKVQFKADRAARRSSSGASSSCEGNRFREALLRERHRTIRSST